MKRDHVRRPVASDLISWGLVLKVSDKLAAISNSFQTSNDTTGNVRLAIDQIWDLTKFLNRFIETEVDEKARAIREQS